MPAPTLGMNSSHTPLAPSERIGRVRVVPAVGVAHQRRPAGQWRPHRECRAAHTLVIDDPRAEALPQAVVRALADEVQVELTERGQEAVGVVHLPLGVGGAVAQPVAGEVRHRHLALEQPAAVDTFHPHHAPGMGDRHLERVGMEGAHHGDVIAGVRTQDLVGVTVHAFGERAGRGGEVDLPVGARHRRHLVASRRKPSGTGTQLGRCAIS